MSPLSQDSWLGGRPDFGGLRGPRRGARRPHPKARTQESGVRLKGRALTSKVTRAVETACRHGFSGSLHLIYITLLEPVLMNAFPIYVQVRRLALERRRIWTASARFVQWRSRKEEFVDRTVSLPKTDILVESAQLDRLRVATGDARELVLADIDQDGFLCSRVGPLKGAPSVSPDLFVPRVRFELTVVDLEGVLAVKKHFKGDLPAFLAELDAAHHLRKSGCRVPAILDVDFDGLAITFEYVHGSVLREELARQGAILRDRDVIDHPSYRSLSPRMRRARRTIEGRSALARVLDRDEVEQVFVELKKIHAAGYVLHDVKFGNIILDGSTNEPRFIDFDRTRSYPELSPLAFRFLRDRDYDKFNVHFGTSKLTHRRALERTKRLPRHFGPPYAPIYIEGGLRLGNVWRTDVGYGRWRYILRKHLPPLADARVLDLGANDGFNDIQMMRHGAREVVAVEIDDRAIARGRLMKDLFEWADNRPYRLVYIHDTMARLPELDLGNFDLITALCSLYYLDDEQIAMLVRHASTITDTLVLQCNTDRRIDRLDPRTFEKASIEYAVGALRRHGFPDVRVIAPRGYSRPLVLGRLQR
jgi:serine/threonine protein kinase